MRRILSFCALSFSVLLFGFPLSTFAQSAQGLMGGARGHVVIPQSSKFTAADAGVRMHTNVGVFVPDGLRSFPSELPPVLGYGFETPASLACIYRLVPPTSGCNPNVTTINPSGGSGAIAIVDAFDDPTASTDLAVYCAQFGLAPANLTVVYAAGSEPPVDPTGGWELEESLDIEMAHAMAPGAKLYLVEANSDLNSDLYPAVLVAANLVSCGQSSCPSGGKGRGEVSMSWAGSEYGNETLADGLFQQPGVVYTTGAGDSPGTFYPCTSPYVVCVGGTATARSISTGNFLYEVAWMDGGGGFSYYEPRPVYQNFIARTVGSTRGVPDVAFDASPSTSTWVYDSNDYEGGPGGWFLVFGTSIGAQAIAGIINAAGNFASSSAAELETLYLNGLSLSAFTDIKRGYCGPYETFAATFGWDFCTGLGSSFGYKGK